MKRLFTYLLGEDFTVPWDVIASFPLFWIHEKKRIKQEFR